MMRGRDAALPATARSIARTGCPTLLTKRSVAACHQTPAASADLPIRRLGERGCDYRRAIHKAGLISTTVARR